MSVDEHVQAEPGPGPSKTISLVVRDVVAAVAPEELVVVDAVVRLPDSVVSARMRRVGKARESLGFGVTEFAALVTPVVWLAVEHAAQRFGEASADGAAKGIKALTRKLTRRPAPPTVVPPLSPEQLDEVRRRVLELAEQRGGMDQERAGMIADAVVARLALPAAPASGSNPGTETGENGRLP
ncbi:hypothetical protein ACWDUL_01665 [Nocardia niigatensis]